MVETIRIALLKTVHGLDRLNLKLRRLHGDTEDFGAHEWFSRGTGTRQNAQIATCLDSCRELRPTALKRRTRVRSCFVQLLRLLPWPQECSSILLPSLRSESSFLIIGIPLSILPEITGQSTHFIVNSGRFASLEARTVPGNESWGRGVQIGLGERFKQTGIAATGQGN